MAARSRFTTAPYLPNGLSRFGRLVPEMSASATNPAGMRVPKLSATSESMWIKHLLGGLEERYRVEGPKRRDQDIPGDLLSNSSRGHYPRAVAA
jgi:hypothetical protein